MLMAGESAASACAVDTLAPDTDGARRRKERRPRRVSTADAAGVSERGARSASGQSPEPRSVWFVRVFRYLRHKRRVLRARERLNRAELRSDERSLSLDMAADTGTLLLAFGGINQRIGMPPFEFFSLAGDIAVKKIFVRDLRQSWYHRGIPGAGEDLLSVSRLLGEILEENRVDRLVVAGGSAGGYAALVYGTLLGADTVLCFSPQTTLERSELHRIGDRRWDDLLAPLRRRGQLDRRWVDLATALPRERTAPTRYELFVDDSLDADRRHAERLRGLPGLRLYRFGAGGHELVRELRDRGVLAGVLRRALQAPPEPS
jgi:hypothetical protein